MMVKSEIMWTLQKKILIYVSLVFKPGRGVYDELVLYACLSYSCGYAS